MWNLKLACLATMFIVGGCGSHTDNRQEAVPETAEAAVDSSVLEAAANRQAVAPAAVIARVPKSQLQTQNFDSVEFVSISSSASLTNGSDVATAFRGGETIAMADVNPNQEDAEGFGLCGGCGGGCGGGGFGGGGFGGGCGAGIAPWGIVRGFVWGAGLLVAKAVDIAAHVVHATVGTVAHLGQSLLHYTPTFAHNGFGYGYGCEGSYEHEDYEYYVYKDGGQFQQSGFGQPGFGQPGFGQPGFGQPGFGQPNYNAGFSGGGAIGEPFPGSFNQSPCPISDCGNLPPVGDCSGKGGNCY